MGGRRPPKRHVVHTPAAELPEPQPRPGGVNEGRPYVPEVGECGWIRTSVYGQDPAEWRPFVVYEVSPLPSGYIRIATRTSEDVAGVPHPADRSLGFGKRGTFSDTGLVRRDDWTSNNVRYQGVLAQPFIDEVLAWFQ